MWLGCSDPQFPLEDSSVSAFRSDTVPPTISSGQHPFRATKLGQRLKNPYLLSTMQQAKDTILALLRGVDHAEAKKIRDLLGRVEIKATHHYVRLLPKDRKELFLLKKDTFLSYHEIPLDYKIEEGGSYYHDPTLSPDQITWQYVVVKPEYVFPSQIQKELLAEAFMPRQSEYYDPSVPMLEDPLSLLEMVAYYLTDNLSEAMTQKMKKAFEEARQPSPSFVWGSQVKIDRCIWFICWRDWVDGFYPLGNIFVEKTTTRGLLEGVEGVRVRAWRFLDERVAFTDAKGHFQMLDGFVGYAKVNYDIVWERYDFEVRTDTWFIFPALATLSSSGTNESWNLVLPSGSRDWYHAMIFMAAHHYYYKDIQGLRRPPQPAFLKVKVNLRMDYSYADDVAGYHTSLGVIPPFDRIVIKRRREDILGSELAPELYATVIHELAHASHYNANDNIIEWELSVSKKVKESWATGVQWALTRMKYSHNYRGREYNLNYPDYTLVVADMIDGTTNIPDAASNGRSYPNDRVSGYTIKQVEDAVIGISSWGAWLDKMKNSYSNGTKQYLPELFRVYE